METRDAGVYKQNSLGHPSSRKRSIEASEGLLDVRDLRTHLFLERGVLKAVDGVNLRVGEAEIVGLVGESGCGKTMTALSIMRLIPSPPAKIVSGTVLFKNLNLLDLSKDDLEQVRGKDISMVFQDPMTYLNPVIKIGEQISETIIKHQKISKSEAAKEAIRILKLMEIGAPAEVAEKYPHQLSGGMRQRVLIGIALSCNPSLLIADEPTTALDVTIQAQLMDFLKETQKRLNFSILLITHDLGIVAELCDRVYIMYAGNILEEGSSLDIFRGQKHPYTIGLLKSVLRGGSARVESLHYIEGRVPSLIDPPSGCRFHPRCQHAMPICEEEFPPTCELAPDHKVRCWLFR